MTTDQAVLAAGPIMVLISHFVFPSFNTINKCIYNMERPVLSIIFEAQAIASRSISIYIFFLYIFCISMFVASYYYNAIMIIPAIFGILASLFFNSRSHYKIYSQLKEFRGPNT